jgi:cytochrome c-type biogenesis protein CcmH
MFWLFLALMTGASIGAVIWPLAQTRRVVRSGSDVEVYRDQLDELERDLKAGSIGRIEAEAARVEIARRLLAAADAAKAEAAKEIPATTSRYGRTAVAVALLLLPLGAVSLYLRLGSPELASQYSVAGSSPDQQTAIESMVAKVEAHLQKNPKDGRGWEVLAPVYLKLGRYSDSVRAWRSTLSLLGETADRQANLGEALVAEANGIVTDDANNAFIRAVTLDKTIVSARYYLGLAAEQDGKRDQAAAIWLELIAEAPADAHWVGDVRTALARVEGASAEAQRRGASPGAPPAQPQHNDDTVQSMVDRLAARLKKTGSDPDGWVMLVRSYATLGQNDKVTAAITDARAALGGDKTKLQAFDEALRRFDVGQPESSKTPASAPATSPSVPARADESNSEMIRGMVSRLAERLKQDGSDFDGWMRLVRSYVVLGERDKAVAAAADARRIIANDADKRRRFDEFVKSLGLES